MRIFDNSYPKDRTNQEQKQEQINFREACEIIKTGIDKIIHRISNDKGTPNRQSIFIVERSVEENIHTLKNKLT